MCEHGHNCAVIPILDVRFSICIRTYKSLSTPFGKGRAGWGGGHYTRCHLNKSKDGGGSAHRDSSLVAPRVVHHCTRPVKINRTCPSLQTTAEVYVPREQETSKKESGLDGLGSMVDDINTERHPNEWCSEYFFAPRIQTLSGERLIYSQPRAIENA